MTALSTDELKARRAAAAKENAITQPLRDDAYRYAIPFRKGTSTSGPGGKRVDEVFDHTAIDSAFRFAGKIQQDFWPVGQKNFELEPGVLVTEKTEKEKMAEQLAVVSARVQAGCFENGDFDQAFHEMALDLGAGTGAILMNPGDGVQNVWEPISVPIDELVLEAGGNNKISGMFWRRKMTVRQVFDTWPDGSFSRDLKKMMKETPADEIAVNYDTVFVRDKDPVKSRWHMVIWTEKQKSPIYKTQSRTCPWAIPRYFRVPGETHGRGPLMLAMPTIKTLNTAARLQLQAAAIALLGIYTAVDDSSFNPHNSPIAPGVFWKVGRNGGPLGPSVSRLPDPRLDLTGLVIENMQANVKATMLDQALPVEGAAVKSATEILERVKRLANDHIGAFGRLIKELTIPAVQRGIELSYEAGLLPDNINIDQLLVRMRVKSPLAIAHEMQQVQKLVQWIEMVIAILTSTGRPDRIDEIVKIDDALRQIGNKMGVPMDNIVSLAEAKVIREDKQKQALALAAAQAAGAGAGAQMEGVAA